MFLKRALQFRSALAGADRIARSGALFVRRERKNVPPREGRTRKKRKIEIETISSRHGACLLDFFVCREKRKRTSRCKHQLVPGGGRWIRPSADGPFRGSDAPPARHSLPLPFESTGQKEKTVTPDGATVFLGGGRWIRTTEVTDNRFTVCPLWPLGNSPIFTCSWSW